MKCRKILLIIAGCVILALAAVLLLTQAIFTVSVTPAEVRCESWDAAYISIEAAAERCDSGKMYDYEHAYSYNGSLPSNDPDDYMSIYCYFDVKNRSFIDQYTINAVLKNSSKYSDNILFVSDADAAYTVSAHRGETSRAYIILDVYTGDLTESQIRELVGGLTVSVKADGKFFGTKSKDVSFENCGDIIFERG